jgi:hypothetical protein
VKCANEELEGYRTTKVVSCKRGTLEGVDESFYMSF